MVGQNRVRIREEGREDGKEKGREEMRRWRSEDRDGERVKRQMVKQSTGFSERVWAPLVYADKEK